MSSVSSAILLCVWEQRSIAWMLKLTWPKSHDLLKLLLALTSSGGSDKQAAASESPLLVYANIGVSDGPDQFQKTIVSLGSLACQFLEWFNSWPASHGCLLTTLQTVWNQIRPEKTSSLIWIQTFWRSGCIHERIFWKKRWFWKQKRQMTESMQNYPAGK